MQPFVEWKWHAPDTCWVSCSRLLCSHATSTCCAGVRLHSLKHHSRLQPYPANRQELYNLRGVPHNTTVHRLVGHKHCHAAHPPSPMSYVRCGHQRLPAKTWNVGCWRRPCLLPALSFARLWCACSDKPPCPCPDVFAGMLHRLQTGAAS